MTLSGTSLLFFQVYMSMGSTLVLAMHCCCVLGLWWYIVFCTVGCFSKKKKKKKLILLLFAILWNRFFKMWSMWRVLISSNVSDSFLSFKSVILQEILKGCDGLSWKCLTYIDLLINTCVKICVTQHICTQVDLRGNCFSHRICWKSFGQILLNVQLISRLRQGLLFFHNFPPKGSSLLNNSLFLL